MEDPTGAWRPVAGSDVTVADLGEHQLIERIRDRAGPPPTWVRLGIGDDAAVIERERNTLEVITTDAVIEGIHFERAFVPPDAVGHKALAVSLSDLAAMGAWPRFVLLSLALPATMAAADFDALVGGFLALAAPFGLPLVGGNITRSPGPLQVDVTAAGSVKPRRVLSRAGARPGHELYVSGALGAVAGLQSLRERAEPHQPSALLDRPHSEPRHRPLAAEARYLRPDPRVRLGVGLARNRAASACVDLSDGLADGIRQLARASDVGAVIDAGALPIDPEVRRWFQEAGVDPLRAVMAGGDDYELLVAVPARPRGRLETARRLGRGVPLTRIGVITADRAIVLRRHGQDEDLPAGFAHFR